MPQNTITCLVPRERENRLAIVSCDKTREIQDSNDLLRQLCAAISDWVKNTQEGLEAWKQSCCDFNIGDLDLYYGYASSSVKSYIESSGIFNFHIKIFGNDDMLNGNWSYDTILVELDEEELHYLEYQQKD